MGTWNDATLYILSDLERAREEIYNAQGYEQNEGPLTIEEIEEWVRRRYTTSKNS